MDSRVSTWLTTASPVLPVAPRPCRCVRYCEVAALPWLMCSVSEAWWNSLRCCHSVTDTAVDTLDASVRQKLARPDALAIWSGRRPDRKIWFRGMKKQAMPMPMMNRGGSMEANDESLVKSANQNEQNANTMKAKVTTARNSSRWMFAPMKGETTKASTPTGAAARPAQGAV